MSSLDLQDHINKLLGKANRAASNLKSEIPQARAGDFSSICKDLQDIINAIHEARAVSGIIELTGMDELVFSQVQDATTFTPKPIEGQMHDLCTSLLEAVHEETLKKLDTEVQVKGELFKHLSRAVNEGRRVMAARKGYPQDRVAVGDLIELQRYVFSGHFTFTSEQPININDLPTLPEK